MTIPNANLSAAARRTPQRTTPIHHYAALLFLFILLAALMLYPLYVSVAAAFSENGHPTTHWFTSVLQNATFRAQLLNSLLLGCVVTLLCNLIAFPLALIARHYDFRAKLFFTSLILAPMILPPFVGAIGLRRILGTFGSFTILLQNLHLLSPSTGIDWLTGGGPWGGFWAMAALIALGLFPIAYLNLQASLANIDPAMLEAAQNLGGTRLRNFFRITLPLAMPGIFAGSTLVFIWAFTELGTPLQLQYSNVVSRSIWDDIAGTTEGKTSAGFAKVILVLATCAAVYVVGKITLGRSGHAMTSKAATGTAAKRLTGPRALLAIFPFALITFLAILPHIGVLLYSFTAIAAEPGTGWGTPGEFGWYRSLIPTRYTLAGYQAVLQTPEIYGAILNSIKYAGVATLIDIFLGISIAWVLVRTTTRGRLALDSLAMLPLAVPGIVMAFGFIAVALQLGRYFHFDAGDYLRNAPFLILVIAYAVRRLPYLVRSAAGGLQQTSVTLEEAAANLGASPLRVLFKITLPLILANLIAGSILTFSFAMMEVSDSLILAQYPQHFPITKMINTLGNDMSSPTSVRNACALGVLAMAFMATTLGAAAALMGKKLGAIFRA